MRRFCRWLVTEGEVDNAPTDGIEIATAPDKPVPILTDVESTALLKTCAVGRGRAGTFARPIFLGRRGQTVSWRELPTTMPLTREPPAEQSRGQHVTRPHRSWRPRRIRATQMHHSVVLNRMMARNVCPSRLIACPGAFLASCGFVVMSAMARTRLPIYGFMASAAVLA
jgi:hypothetical protein